jgi:DNA polymerase-3 subunit beta
VDQAALKMALKQVRFASSTDTSRYVLNGVLFEAKDGVLTLVATDGRRLAASLLIVPNAPDAAFILPNKAVNEVIRLIDDEGSLVSITFNENAAFFEFKTSDCTVTSTLRSKLVEGNYPPFRQVIPKDSAVELTLNREEFAAAVKRTSLFTTEKFIAITLALSKNLLTLTANTPEIGEAKEELSVKFTGKGAKIAFNPDYLRDALEALETDEVTLKLSDATAPGLIEVQNFRYVLMPCRLSDEPIKAETPKTEEKAEAPAPAPATTETKANENKPKSKQRKPAAEPVAAVS